jgi:ribonuclease BN (tRNA processing enzyme)
MRLKVLGCSGGIGVDRRTTSLLVDDDILIDAGSGVGNLSLEEMSRVAHIFLTHSHLDHFAFLPLLVDTMFPLIKRPLVVHGQSATLKALQDHVFNWAIWPDFSKLPNAQNPVMRYEVMKPGDVVQMGTRSFEMIEVNHIVPCVGYRVAGADGAAFAFSGDTTTNDTLWAALNAHARLDLLIVEAAFPNSEEELSKASRHYTPGMLAADIVKLKHQPKIYISHPKPGQESTIFRECKSAMTNRDINPLAGGETFNL